MTNGGNLEVQAIPVKCESSPLTSTEIRLHAWKETVGLVIEVVNFSIYSIPEGRTSDR